MIELFPATAESEPSTILIFKLHAQSVAPESTIQQSKYDLV